MKHIHTYMCIYMTYIYTHVRAHTHGLICMYTTYIHKCACIQKRETTAATQYSKGASFAACFISYLQGVQTHVTKRTVKETRIKKYSKRDPPRIKTNLCRFLLVSKRERDTFLQDKEKLQETRLYKKLVSSSLQARHVSDCL